MLHLHPLPGDENRYSPEEFEREVRPLIKFGPTEQGRPRPEWLTHPRPAQIKITERLYEPPTKSYYDSKEWREYLSREGVYEYSADGSRVTKCFGMDIFVVDHIPRDVHAQPDEPEPPTLWQRFMAWLRGTV